jgi:sec-independent protein translocase protein TatA
VPFAGFHWFELIIVFALALLFFGPKRLPEMGSAIGKTIKEFQKSIKEVSAPAEDKTPAALPPAPPAAPSVSVLPEAPAPSATVESSAARHTDD